MTRPTIIYQDNSLLVIDKPAGMMVNRADSVQEKTVADWIIDNGYWIMDIGEEKKRGDYWKRKGIVHRLDKETSGVLLVAKSEQAFIDLQEQFKKRQVVKKYLALVYGKVKPKEGTIIAPLARSHLQREQFTVYPGGRQAETGYKVLKYFADYTLLEVYPKTGRTHQIRVHLKYFGYPVVSDLKYGGKRAKRDRKSLCPRQFLHAEYIKFRHPVSRKMVEVKSELPNDLSSVLKRLNNIQIYKC